MDIPGHLTPSAEAALSLCKFLAEGRKERLSSLHLLLGILSCEDCSITVILLQMGYDLGKLKSTLKTTLGSHVSGDWQGDQPTVELVDALRRSDEEAELSSSKVGTAHLMLGLVRENTLARLFLDKAVNLEQLEREIAQLYPATRSVEDQK